MKHEPHDIDCKKSLKKYMEVRYTCNIRTAKSKNTLNIMLFYRVFYINNFLSLFCISFGVEKGIIVYNLHLEPENMIPSYAFSLSSASFYSFTVPPFHHFTTSY